MARYLAFSGHIKLTFFESSTKLNKTSLPFLNPVVDNGFIFSSNINDSSILIPTVWINDFPETSINSAANL